MAACCLMFVQAFTASPEPLSATHGGHAVVCADLLGSYNTFICMVLPVRSGGFRCGFLFRIP